MLNLSPLLQRRGDFFVLEKICICGARVGVSNP